MRELNILESELNKLERLKIKKIIKEIDELTNGSNNKLRIGSKCFSQFCRLYQQQGKFDNRAY